MIKKITETETLLDAKHALHVYLDSLLSEVTVSDEPGMQQAVEELPLQAHAAAMETPPAVTVEAKLADMTGETPATQGQAATETSGAAAEPAGRAVPSWANGEFQSLSFQVSGLTLAAPLDKLNGIVELKEELTELPGYASWVLGVLNNRGQNIQVIDLGQIVMHGRSGKPSANDNHYKYVVLVDGGNFGLAADSLSQVLSLRPEDVRWRGAKGKRPWLAGTVIEQMCAILDVDNLCRELETGMAQ